MAEDLDVVVIGAGVSGVNAAYQLLQKLPRARIAVLEGRDTIGGTWAFWQYPGFRNDSAMTSFGFQWHPWADDRLILDGPSIHKYVEEAARAHGIDKLVRLQHRVSSASWSSKAQMWTLGVDVKGEKREVRTRFVLFCSGYYSYEKARQTKIPGLDRFKGTVVHPQWWPRDLDYANKRVVIVGSGATAVTLLPALAETAASVTMVQRSPSYVVGIPAQDKLFIFLKKFLPLVWAQYIRKTRDLLRELIVTTLMAWYPNWGRRVLTDNAKTQLPKGYPVDIHFNPRYNPFEQRLCMCPDNDFFEALKQENCEIITDTIDTVTETGLQTKSGVTVPADIIITATGLHVELFYNIKFSVDDKSVDPSDRYVWRCSMLEGVPNACLVIGYVTQPWTRGADTITCLMIRIIKHMQSLGATSATPFIDRTKDLPRLPVLPASSTYLVEAQSRLPLATNTGPWYQRRTLVTDKLAYWFGSITEGMVYRKADGTVVR